METEKPRPWTEEEINEARSLLERGHTVAFVAYKLNRTCSSIYSTFPVAELRKFVFTDFEEAREKESLVLDWFLSHGFVAKHSKGIRPPADLVVVKDDREFGVNVKSGKNYVLQKRNIERLLEKFLNVAFVFIIDENLYWAELTYLGHLGK